MVARFQGEGQGGRRTPAECRRAGFAPTPPHDEARNRESLNQDEGVANRENDASSSSECAYKRGSGFSTFQDKQSHFGSNSAALLPHPLGLTCPMGSGLQKKRKSVRPAPQFSAAERRQREGDPPTDRKDPACAAVMIDLRRSARGGREFRPLVPEAPEE